MATESQYYEDQNPEYQPRQNIISPQVAPYINDYNTGHADLIKLALQSGDLMEDLRMNLLALEWDIKQKKFVENKLKPPLIKEMGAQKVITIVSHIVNRNAHLSNLKEEDIRIICKELEHNIRLDFFDNWNVYWDNEWQAESNWTIVRSMAGNYAKLALLRALNGREMTILGGGTRTFINKSEVESSQRITEIPNKRFGFFK